jgi:tetratricopeptide (TPR) repeat protein
MKKITIYFLMHLLIESTGTAQAYLQGYSRYQRGNFKGAIAAFESAISKAKNKSDLLNIYKYLGMSFYSDGQKDRAAESFKKALTIDSKLEINPDEVLDKGLLDFVNGIRSSIGSPIDPNSQKIAANSHPESSPPNASSSPNSNEDLGTPKDPKSNPTTISDTSNGNNKIAKILIKTNASNAKILVDGNVLGIAGENLIYKPGIAIIIIEAPGYKTRKIRYNIKNDQENRLTIPLRKISSHQGLDPKSPNASLASDKKNEDQDHLFTPPNKKKRKKGEKTKDDSGQNQDIEDYSGFWATNGASHLSKNSETLSNSDLKDIPAEKRWSPAWNLVPFGFGQFINNRPILGITFMTLEFAILYQSISFQNKASKSQKDANKLASADKVSSTDQDQINKKNNESDAAIKKATLSQIGFIMIWIAGSAQAAIDLETNPLTSSKSSKLGMNSRFKVSPVLDSSGPFFLEAKFIHDL